LRSGLQPLFGYTNPEIVLDRYSWIDTRYDYDEERIITLGRSGNVVLVVVTAEGNQAEDDEECIRIISVRKAVEEETDWYYLGRA
jgi:uncharacterized DUF497 family protein